MQPLPRLPPLWGQQSLLRRAYSYFRFPPPLHSPPNLPQRGSLLSHPHLSWERPYQPSNHIHTWRDLLLPNGWDTHVELVEIDKAVQEKRNIVTSTFAPPAFSFYKLPSEVHLVKDLPLRMQEHLRQILDQNRADQASRTIFTNEAGFDSTPDAVLNALRKRCNKLHFPLKYEHGASAVGDALSDLVTTIHDALMETEMLKFRRLERAEGGAVITDQTYLLARQIKFLFGSKSPAVFDKFVGGFMKHFMKKSLVRLRYRSTSKPSKLRGSKAIFGKVRLVASVSNLLPESLPPARLPCKRR